MENVPNGKEQLEARWKYLEGKKSGLMTRCEEYASWTLPWLFPIVTANAENTENQLSNDSIGARAVNHLSNKVVSTLFSPQRPFFRLRLSKKNIKQIKMLTEGKDPAEVAVFQSQIDSSLADTEQEAIERLDMVAYRPQCTYAAQLMIVTGNALIYHPDNQPVQVFNVRDYCVVRDLSGVVIEIMTRECKSFETFHPDVQVQLRAYKQQSAKQYEDKDEVTVYTNVKLHDDGKFYARQEASCVELDIADAFWPRSKLPWVTLTWNLVRGEDYGRGLVEDYSGAFHAITVLTQSLLNIAGIMGDLKFLVNPMSVLDVPALNKSPPGSYHSGKEGDVTAIETKKQQDAQFIVEMIKREESQISQAFLLGSGAQRDAERVTAEEIRRDANELETSNGGIYSRLALQWQLPTAYIVLDQIGFDGGQWGITPQIVTGMDSLSRSGELDNLQLFVEKLALLNGVPPSILQAIDPLKFAAVIAVALQIDYQKFMRTQAEYQAEQQREAQQQQQLEQAKGQTAMASEAGKQVMKAQ